jgi:hypothetical protein
MSAEIRGELRVHYADYIENADRSEEEFEDLL